MAPWSRFLDAESRLVERRRAQRGKPTLGDDADAALLAALCALPASAHEIARASGLRIGRDIYARRFCEDALPGAIGVLSGALLSTGAGAFEVEHTFHRHARVRFSPTPALAAADPLILQGFLEGTLEGFFGAAFNSAAHARANDGHYELELGEGRDVNREVRR